MTHEKLAPAAPPGPAVPGGPAAPAAPAAPETDRGARTAGPTAGVPLGAGVTRRPGRWLDGWDPENPTQWTAVGRRIARRNLGTSVYAEFLGFVVWALWSVIVPQLPAAGFDLTVDQMFWLIAVPSLVGATLRIPYTFAVPVLGGRNWTVVSALLLLVPLTALAIVVQDPTTPFGTLLAVAALAGVGGGNFASSMANISFFYPEAAKGRALGLNAAGGNLGTAAVQLVVPLVVVTAAGVRLERAALLLVPLVLGAAVLAWRSMDNLAGTRSDMRAYALAATRRHTWLVSMIYIGTFGSFIGFASVFPTLLASTFPEVTVSIAFLGALVGSVARPLGGALADRVGGARVTLGAFGVMAAGVVGAILALRAGSFVGFLGCFLVLFVATGAGNGSVYRMIPAVFRHGATDDADRAHRARVAAGCLGVAGAVGAFGGFLVPRGFAASTAATGGIEAALWVVVGVYALLATLTWAVYARRGTALGAAGV